MVTIGNWEVLQQPTHRVADPADVRGDGRQRLELLDEDERGRSKGARWVTPSLQLGRSIGSNRQITSVTVFVNQAYAHRIVRQHANGMCCYSAYLLSA
jgi:hypothetical protein